MIQDRPYSTMPRQSRRSRQRVVRSGAQYARYFMLGLVVVSMFVGLNVSLAGRTAELAVSIRDLERECSRLEWENAEKVSRIALETNIDEVERFALEKGFATPSNVIYVSSEGTVSVETAHGDVTPSDLSLPSTSSAPEVSLGTTIWRATGQRLRNLLPTFERREHIASAR